MFSLASGLLDLLDPRPGETIVDLGCGTGELAARIRDAGSRVGEYAGLLRSNGFLVARMEYFPRPTELTDCPNGVADWVRMFGNAMIDHVPTAVLPSVLDRVNELTATTLFRDGRWYADYYRLRFVAIADTASASPSAGSPSGHRGSRREIRSRAGPRPAYEERMTDTALTVRTLQSVDADDVAEVVHQAFLADATPASKERELSVFEPGRYHGVFDSETMIGVAGILTRDLTVPGLVPVPVAAVTAVGVLPDHRRRGALTMLMRTQLHELHEKGGESIAALWASEGEIYGRFGYGLASQSWRMSLQRPVRFREPAPAGTPRAQLLGADQARIAIRKLHGEYVSNRVGGLSRPEQGWTYVLHDDPSDRGGASAMRFAVHPGGYTIFRIRENWQPGGPRHELMIRELASTTVEGHAAIWRFLLDMDLVGEVRYFNTPLDEPLQMMLTNPCAVRAELTDALFVRLVDLDRALAARRYATPGELVFDVTDELCPWNAGRWRLSVDQEGAGRVERTTAAADLACDVIDLGAAYLGGTRLGVLAAAGRVREFRAGAAALASRVFAGENEPHCLEVF